MQKILYFMHIDWDWLYQRPQIFASFLSCDYDVTVVYLKEIFRKTKTGGNKKGNIHNLYAVPAVPFRDKHRLFFGIEKALLSGRVRNFDSFDIIWLCHPALVRYIPERYAGRIIYDCMDNHEAFTESELIRKTIREAESVLSKRADTTFFSSESLYQKKASLFANRTALVRNGIFKSELHDPVSVSFTDTKSFRIGYFGTISRWFDFSAVLYCLEKIEELEVYLWGKTEISNCPVHPRLHYKGTVEHRKLFEETKTMSAFIMPFIPNSLVKDVDPVKLYEFIGFGKPVLSVYYKELEYFKDFVNYYRNRDELLQQMKALMSGTQSVKYTSGQQRNFISNNSWEKRYEAVRELLRQ